MSKKIYIYYKDESNLIGTLYVDTSRNKEMYSFEYSIDALKSNLTSVINDSEIEKIAGRQFKLDSSTPYHFLQDSSPDRWGQNLIKKKLNNKNINYSDYLLNVSDCSRMGALRYKEDINGPFLLDDSNIPPYKFLRELENAAYNYEEFSDDEYWKLLLSPGSSLGGARPKATIYGSQNELYMAKFNHKNDDYDVSKVEYLTYRLAKDVGINFSDSRLIEISSNRSVFLTKRFDRDKEDRIHYVSFMTILNVKEGDSSKYTYLDVAESLIQNSGNPIEDLKELFRRIAFYIIVHNYDDHLRNMGMIYKDGQYRLSPCFDVNITLYNSDLTLSIDGDGNNTLDKLIECASFFRIELEEGRKIIKEMRETISKSFKRVAKEINLDSNIYNHISRFLSVE